MQFEWLNKQGVQSDEGFVLQNIGRFEWQYREGDRVLKLAGEGIVGGRPGFSFSPDWQNASGQPALIGPEDRKRIKRNVQQAMAFMDLQAEFE